MAARPTRVKLSTDGRTPSADGREIFLTWDGAIDDAGCVKACVVCGCTSLFRKRSFPRVMIFVVPLAFAGAVVAALGYAQNPWVLGAMVVLLVIDAAIFFFAPKHLVCYRCRSTYSDTSIARYHHDWDRMTAQRFPAPSLESATT